MKRIVKKKAPLAVGIVMGSISDAGVIAETENLLKKFGLSYKKTVASAHRSPDLVKQFIRQCEAQGAKVFIAAAGGAAALPGVVAAETSKPVIGIPIESALLGLDSLLSIVQMPGGVPVATVAVGKAGAKNAAILAAQIIATSNARLAQVLISYKKEQREKVIADAKKLQGLPS